MLALSLRYHSLVLGSGALEILFENIQRLGCLCHVGSVETEALADQFDVPDIAVELRIPPCLPKALAVGVHRAADLLELLAPLRQTHNHVLEVLGSDVEVAHFCTGISSYIWKLVVSPMDSSLRMPA